MADLVQNIHQGLIFYCKQTYLERARANKHVTQKSYNRLIYHKHKKLLYIIPIFFRQKRHKFCKYLRMVNPP